MKRTVKIFASVLLIAAAVVPLAAQNASQSVKPSRNIAAIVGMPQDEAGKCGTAAMLYALSHMNQLSASQRAQVALAMQRSEKQKNRLSPSRKFRIHYDTSGSDTPALITSGSNPQRLPNTYEQFVDSAALFLDNAWKLEVDTLGYTAPPQDGSAGGGPEIDVYIENIGSGYYGFTTQDSILEDGLRQRWTSFITIHNDFLGFYSPGMLGLRVTTAHEFHHTIQIGSYGIWPAQPEFDRWFLELTSVWMEHNAYPQIKDYYQYLPDYLQRFKDGFNHSYSFNSSHFGGYERCLWALYLEKRFGKNLMKEIWEGIRTVPVLNSMAGLFPAHGTTFETEYALFNSWNFFTADRADPLRYYDEGRNYPRMYPNVTTSFSGLTAAVNSAAYPLSFQSYQIVLTSDTLNAMITNTNVNGALNPASGTSSLHLSLSATDLQPPYQKVARGLGMTFTADTMSLWRAIYFLSSTKANANVAPDVSPNPINLSRDQKLVLPVQGATASTAEVFLLNASLELIYSKQYQVRQAFGNSYLDVPAGDLKAAVATGVYFVFARCGDQEFKWKVAIIK